MTIPEPCFSITTIAVQNDEQEAFEVYPDKTYEQTIGFVFDGKHVVGLFYADLMKSLVEEFLAEWDKMGCSHEKEEDDKCPACRARVVLVLSERMK